MSADPRPELRTSRVTRSASRSRFRLPPPRIGPIAGPLPTRRIYDDTDLEIPSFLRRPPTEDQGLALRASWAPIPIRTPSPDSRAARSARSRRRSATHAAEPGATRRVIQLVAVSKTVAVDRLAAAVAAGLTVLGENRVQEAETKAPDAARRALAPHRPAPVEQGPPSGRALRGRSNRSTRLESGGQTAIGPGRRGWTLRASRRLPAGERRSGRGEGGFPAGGLWRRSCRPSPRCPNSAAARTDDGRPAGRFARGGTPYLRPTARAVGAAAGGVAGAGSRAFDGHVGRLHRSR